MADSFNASKYLIQLKGKDYLEVKFRILWLRTEHPNAIINTELHSMTDSAAVFKATVTTPDGGSATGWGSEEASDFGDFLEKAETKAIGRALGALGFGTQFTDEFEVADQKGQRVVDSPVQRPTQRARAIDGVLPASAPSELDAAFGPKRAPAGVDPTTGEIQSPAETWAAAIDGAATFPEVNKAMADMGRELRLNPTVAAALKRARDRITP